MPKDTSERHSNGAVITPSPKEYGNRPPFFSLPIWLLGLATPQELAVLAALQAHYPDIRPGVPRLAEMAHMSESTVRKVLSSLEGRGWLKRQHRTCPRRGALATRYLLRLWDSPAPPPSPRASTPLRETEYPPSADCTPPLREKQGPPTGKRRGPPPGDGGELDQEQLEQEQEEPPTSLRSVTPPRGGSAPGGQDQQPLEQPEQPDPSPEPPIDKPAPRRRKPRPSPDDSLVELPVLAQPVRALPAAARDPFRSSKLPVSAIPGDLAHCAELFTAWWEVKGKGRTARSFELACTFLRRHDPADQHRMLEAAVMGGWQGLHELSPRHAGSDTVGYPVSNRSRPFNKAQEGLRDFLAIYGSKEDQCSPQTPSVPFSLP